MKNFKKIISIILAGSIIFGTCIGFSGCTGNPNDSAITRGEWIEQLGQKMGLDEYQSKTNYFKDIKEDNEIYPYVQACVEWDILDEEESPFFYEDFRATKGFISETIIRASTILDNEKATEDDILDCAIENDVVNSKSDVNDSVQRKDVEQYLDKAFDLYSNKEFVEYNNVVVNDDVKDISNRNVTSLGDGKYEVNASDLKTDDIVILPPSGEYVSGIARKITKVSKNNGTSIIETTEPELFEVYDQIDFAQSVTPTAENVILEDGVTLDESGNINLEDVIKKAEEEEQAYQQKNKVTVEPLGVFSGTTPKVEETATVKDLKFKYDFVKGKPTISGKFELGETELSKTFTGKQTGFNEQAYNDLKQFFNDKTTFSFKNLPNYGTTKEGWKKTLSGGGKFTSGVECVGSIGFDTLTIDTELELKKVVGIPYGLKHFKVKLDSEASVQSSFKGTMDHEIKIGTTPIPTPIPGISININFYILVSAEGVMTLKIGVGNEVVVEYEDGNWRKTKEVSSEISTEVAITIEFGPGIGVSIAGFGLDIIDVRLDAKGVLEASAEAKFEVSAAKDENDKASTHQKLSVTLKADLYAPTIAIEIGTDKTLAGKIGLGVKWELVKKENAVFHKELYNKEWVLFEANVEEETTEETTATTEMFPEDELDSSELAGFQISTYALDLTVGNSDKIKVSIPENYSESDLKFSSSDTSVATVDSNGNVKGVGSGVAIIKVALGSEELQCTVFVNEE